MLYVLLVSSLVTPLSAQLAYEEIPYGDGKTFLLGEIPREALVKAPYADWFQNNYDNYMVDQRLVALFKDALLETEILLFLGTWCGDSKREVPRFLKLLDAAAFPAEQLKIVALDRRKEQYKKSPGGEEQGRNIQRVPTFILLQKGKEVNRIVERPIESLEEDVYTILSGGEYIPNYAN